MLKTLMVAAALIVLGCGEEKDGEASPAPSHTGGKVSKDASVSRDARSSTNGGEDAAAAPEQDAASGPVDNGKPPAIDDAGSIEVRGPDGGTVVITPGQDGGAQLSSMGSCCAAHDTPGCSNAELMVCVCEKDSTCCTTAWGKQCALLVEQKFCQPAVRDCVCAPDGKVQKADCCDKSWSSLCETYAETVCDAVPGCY